MITRQMLEDLEAYYKSLRDAATTLDIAISEPLYRATQAAWDALQQARVDFITRPIKTPQIEELPVCPLCEDHPATEGVSDRLFSVFMTHEEDIEHHDLICKTCHEDWTARYPEESPATINDRRGWFPKYEHDERRAIFHNAPGYDIDSADSDYSDIKIPF